MLGSFIKRISEMSTEDLAAWLLEGSLACSEKSLRPYQAFKYASLSFGFIMSGNADLHQELTDLYRQLDNGSKTKFSQALTKTIENFPVTITNHKIFEDLIIAGLDTDPELIAEAATEKFIKLEREIRDKLAGTFVFLLSETKGNKSALKLAYTLFDDEKIRSVAAAQILVALCKHDPHNADNYARFLKPHLQIQIQTLNPQNSPRGYERFKVDLSQAVPPGSAVYQILDLP